MIIVQAPPVAFGIICDKIAKDLSEKKGIAVLADALLRLRNFEDFAGGRENIVSLVTGECFPDYLKQLSCLSGKYMEIHNALKGVSRIEGWGNLSKIPCMPSSDEIEMAYSKNDFKFIFWAAEEEIDAIGYLLL